MSDGYLDPEISKTLFDICETLQTLKDQVEMLANSLAPEDEDVDADYKYEHLWDEVDNEQTENEET